MNTHLYKKELLVITLLACKSLMQS